MNNSSQSDMQEFARKLTRNRSFKSDFEELLSISGDFWSDLAEKLRTETQVLDKVRFVDLASQLGLSLDISNGVADTLFYFGFVVSNQGIESEEGATNLAKELSGHFGGESSMAIIKTIIDISIGTAAFSSWRSAQRLSRAIGKYVEGSGVCCDFRTISNGNNELIGFVPIFQLSLRTFDGMSLRESIEVVLSEDALDDVIDTLMEAKIQMDEAKGRLSSSGFSVVAALE